MRGERWVIRRSVISHPGSSPHTRETPPCQRDQGCFCRFIPACAGNARARFTKARSWPVHPRIRGERAVGARVVEPVAGLSPHARGTLRRQQRGSPGRRFIPAYAGNASDEEGADCCFPVHPRIRGERLMRRRWLGRPVGSSPHTRGTRYCTNNECETFRFIPAYAGNEQTVRVARLTWPVHPRIRGERSQRAPRTLATSGSSPHTRGTRPSGGPPPGRKRFIPAYAGNAVSARMPFSMPTVHPRIRGERRIPMRNAGHLFGSSPHTRGTQQRDCPCRALDRFIPAYAGNASS